MSVYWEYTLNFVVGWTWGYEVLALLGYWDLATPNRFVFNT